jgi:hypothetical protein
MEDGKLCYDHQESASCQRKTAVKTSVLTRVDAATQGLATGSVKVNAVPRPGSLSTETRPP